MLAKVTTAAVVGVDGLLIEVEVDLALGLPFFSTVGLAEGAVREAKDRVKAAIKNCGYEFPQRRITVNLAPASVKKEGSGYDLPIALGILSASGVVEQPDEKSCFVGELSLDGAIRSVRGVLPMALAAREKGLSRMFVPLPNAKEAAVIDGLEVIGVERLDQTVELLSGLIEPEPVRVDTKELFRDYSHYPVDFSDVRGQEHVKRAMEVAAAGGHNLLLSGNPGAGKTMLARRLPTILPDCTLDEAIETTRIYSSSGNLPGDTPLLVTRPFRAPHHTISDAGLIGGGQIPKPGEVSLAHNGVLFLDELLEFRKHVLEVMRQPLEDGHVTIARASSSLRFPSRFMLVAAMNPCPCGYLGDSKKECTCTPTQIQRYTSRLSGPLLDRIDMHVEVPPVPVTDMQAKADGDSSATIRQRVNQARKRQQKRFRDQEGVYCNAQMASRMVQDFCAFDNQGEQLLRQAVDRLGLSARAYYRILKIARTIADLNASSDILTSHIAEAIQYRRMRYGDS